MKDYLWKNRKRIDLRKKIEKCDCGESSYGNNSIWWSML